MNIRIKEPKIVCLGSHPGIIQSIIDYSYCMGEKDCPVVAIVAGGHKEERYFWGEKEINIQVYPLLADMPDDLKKTANSLLNVQSARRVLSGLKDAVKLLPNLKIINIFAEQVPELHALEIIKLSQKADLLIAGPSSVGLLVPGLLKLGAIAGTQYDQLASAGIFEPGDTAVISTSGGMVNELIHTVTSTGRRVSFAIALGGDRFPITTPADAFLIAENDSNTKQIVYFGELGGEDEYVIADLIKSKKITKPVTAYIAGTVAELFDEPPQFGHAKAMASKKSETASSKKEALRDVGVNVVDVFGELGKQVSKGGNFVQKSDEHRKIGDRKKHLIVSHLSGDVDGDVKIFNKDLLEVVNSSSLPELVLSLLLGEQTTSPKLVEYTDYVLKLLVDHGPYVSGAVNTIISARAGIDLPASLAAGLLTIGPRFGGAVNAAAKGWLTGASNNVDPKDFVENYKENNGIISGIGHKKYRIDLPDPRVAAITKKFTSNSNGDKYLNFAKSVELITTSKKANLILNVDGAIAAVLLDLLESELKYDSQKLGELVDIEFFNAFFVISRSIGFTAHYLDQKRHDEGLLRFGDEEIVYIP